MKLAARWAVLSVVAVPVFVLFQNFSQTAGASGSLPKRLYVFGGQSNMVGRGGEINQLTIGDFERGDGYKRVSMFINRQGIFNPIELGVNTVQWPQPPGGNQKHFGVEWSFAGAFVKDPANGRARANFVKYAVSGTSLTKDTEWDPWGTKGNLFDGLIETVKQARMKSATELKCLTWIQGEADRNLIMLAKDPAQRQRIEDEYRANLAKLIDEVRYAGGSPQARVALIALSEIGEDKALTPATARIRRAQKAIADADKRVVLVSSNGLKKLPDGVHYDADSLYELGRRIYRACEN